jgi:Putative stress-responsive transcriptional regulator
MIAMTTGPGAELGADGATEARRLRRRTSDRVIGGVAGGVGDYLNIDPLLLRVAFAGLMIFGGAGLVLYVAAWLLIPALGRDASIAEDLLARLGRRIGTVGRAILVLLGVVLVAGYLNRYGAWFTGDAPFVTRDAVVLAVAVIVGGIVILRWREGPRGLRAASAVAGPIASDVATEPTPRQAAAWSPDIASVAVAEPQPRNRSPLGWYVVAVTLGAVGALALIGNLPGLSVSLGQYFGVVLAIVGSGLAVGAWWGHARILILLGLLLLPVAVAAAFINVPLNGGFAEQVFRPATVGEIRSEYRLAGGEIQLDLTDLPAGAEPIGINASVGVGVLRVTVPPDARLELTAQVGAGRLSLFGNQQTGTGLGDGVERLEGVGQQFVLTLDIGVGAVVVDTAPRNGG